VRLNVGRVLQGAGHRGLAAHAVGRDASDCLCGHRPPTSRSAARNRFGDLLVPGAPAQVAGQRLLISSGVGAVGYQQGMGRHQLAGMQKPH